MFQGGGQRVNWRNNIKGGQGRKIKEKKQIGKDRGIGDESNMEIKYERQNEGAKEEEEIK